MAVICHEYDLLFTHVPQTGGAFVSELLTQKLGGELVEPIHGTFRRTRIERPPSIRVFTVREPVSWYLSYWAHSRAAVNHPAAWPVRGMTDSKHPTHPIDVRCGHHVFARFIENVLHAFPDGFLRPVYCDFLNGSTHVLRFEHLSDDLETLLSMVGYNDPTVVRSLPDLDGDEAVRTWKSRASLPRDVELRLREVENLDGLSIPYLASP